MTLSLDPADMVASLYLLPPVVFVVHGEPIPQGSTKAFVNPRTHRAIVTSDNKRTRPWRALIDDAARQVCPEPLRGPVVVKARFTMPRPKSRPKRDLWPDRKPDLDKLARALLDALTGPVLVDDSQVVALDVQKLYVGHPRALRDPGAVVEVQAVTS